MYKTRKEFLRRLMELTHINSMKEADRLAQAVIGLIKARIPYEVSRQIAQSVPGDLAMGWRDIALPGEAMEMQEMMPEMDEVAEQPKPPVDTHPPEYG